MKITCLVTVFNEEDKIRRIIGHASKWADEVLIVDKSSTDNTAQIARELGARVETIPFSKQGHEDTVFIHTLPSHDWIWNFTSSEIPTKGLIEAGKQAIEQHGESIDVFYVPFVYFSFGIHNQKSPWSVSYQPRITRKSRAKIINCPHEHVVIDKDRTRMIQLNAGCYAVHQIHSSVKSFLTSHIDYMEAEANKPDPQKQISKALQMAGDWEKQFKSDPELFPQHLAWKIYWYGVALACWERMQTRSFSEEYRARADKMLADYWA